MIITLDVSAAIYVGMTNGFGKTAQYKGLPSGGIYFLLTTLGSIIKDGNLPVLVFDSPTNAREILPEYKGSRSRFPNVRFQTDVAYKYLKDAIPNCYKVSGYEADWLAANLADRFRPNRGHSAMSFRTVDYDWCHNIVDDSDVFRPIAKDKMTVDVHNFETIFSGANFTIPLNAVSAKKVFFGDKSDNIKPFSKQELNEKYINVFVQYCANNHLDTRNLDSMLEFIDKFSGIFGDRAADLINRAKVIYPRKFTEDIDLEIKLKYAEPAKLTKLCSLFGCKSIANRLGIDYYEDMGQLQKELYGQYKNVYLAEKTNLFEEKLSNKSINVDLPDRGGFIL